MIEVSPLFVSTSKSWTKDISRTGLAVEEILNDKDLEDFFGKNWIHPNQEINVISGSNSESMKLAMSLDRRIREIGGNPHIKLPDFHCKMRLSSAKSTPEIIEALRRQHDKPRFRPHLNPLTMKLDEVKPKYLLDSQGRPLLYPGAVHFIYGQPQTLKSMLMHSLTNKNDIRYIDFENTFPILKQRLKIMGVEAKDGAKFDKPQSKSELEERKREYLETSPEIVVFDSMANLLRTFEYSQDNNDDVTDVFVNFINPLRDAGICVVIIDHLPKDDNSSEYPIGAQAKKQQSDVMYLMRKIKGSKSVDMFVTKDRNHQILARCDETQSLIHYGQVA